MKLVTYKTAYVESLGILVNGQLFDLNACDILIPDNMAEFLEDGRNAMDRAELIEKQIRAGEIHLKPVKQYEFVTGRPD